MRLETSGLTIIQSNAYHLISQLPCKMAQFHPQPLSPKPTCWTNISALFWTQNLVLNQVPHHHQLFYFLQSPALRSAYSNFCQPWRPKPHLVLITSPVTCSKTLPDPYHHFCTNCSTYLYPPANFHQSGKFLMLLQFPKVEIHHSALIINPSPFYHLYPKLLNASFTANY